MHVAEIWRYPVKSMGAERLEQARLSALGIDGDRVVQVRSHDDALVTARSHPDLLGHHATLDTAGEPLVDGRPWRDPRVLADVRQIAGPEATLIRDDSVDRFDVLPLLVATDGAIAAFGMDRRRLRPNLVIGGVEGLDERTWPGNRLRIGEVVIGVQDLRGRCVVTTFRSRHARSRPERTPRHRQALRRETGPQLRGAARGVIELGQEVELLRAT